MSRTPAYGRHKASGQARVCIDGRDHYLGPYGSPESKAEYARLIDRWKLRQRAGSLTALTVGELILLYDAHAAGYYRKGGKATSEVSNIRSALRPLAKSHSRKQAADFGPRDLKSVREQFVDAGLCRYTVNKHVGRIVRMFAWAVAEEHVRPETLVALRVVTGLRKGRTPARETEPVQPVAESAINAVLPHVSRQVRDMIRLQLLTGARPSEICLVRPCDLNRDGESWEYVPGSHKTEHHGQSRRIYLGPRAQAILGHYLENRPADAFCFSPREAEAGRRAEMHAVRHTPLSCGNRPGSNRRGNPKWQPGHRYTAASYRLAIRRACVKAGIQEWAPNRLRHSRATELRRHFGIEAAQVVLGHSKLSTTEVYAERDFSRAAAIMAEVG